LYKSFWSELPQLILGENASLQAVCHDLRLSESYENYPFTIEWESLNEAFLQSDGTVGSIERECETELQIIIQYGNWKKVEHLPVVLVPKMWSSEEQLHAELEELLKTAEEQSRSEKEWKLPVEWKGEALLWMQKTEDWSTPVWIGAILISILIYLLADNDLHREAEKKRQEMKRDYPNLVYKIVLYLGTGMTIRNTMQRIVTEYERGVDEKKRRAVYEELALTCRELQAGVSEAAAYEHFGKRVGVQEYIRLTSLLTQNLKKGNATLLERLREESQKVTQERLQDGRKMGEEASTKLLLPMVMMLLVVMLVIMIPAFSSVGV